MYRSEIEGFRLLETTEKDCKKIVQFIREIAEYEKLLHEVVATEESIAESIFKENRAKVLFLEYEGKEIGYVLYFFNYSTFNGRAGLYLEDIYIRKEYRGKGFGKEVFKYLAQTAIENKCMRMEWVCLNWNTPSQEFYKSMGAIPMEEWTTFRLERNNIEKLANS